MRIVISILLITGFLFSGFHNVCGQKNTKKFSKRDRVLKKLDLTENQIQLFKELHFAKEERKIELESSLKKNKLEIKKLITQEDFEEDKLYNLVDNGGNIKNEMIKSRISFWLKFNDILSDDQKKILKKHFNELIGGNERILGFDKRKFSREGFKRFHKFGQWNFHKKLNNIEN